jgi:hypothetical protein
MKARLTIGLLGAFHFDDACEPDDHITSFCGLRPRSTYEPVRHV